MAAKVGLRLEVDVGSSLEVSGEKAGTKTVQSEWGVGCRARGSDCTIPLLQEERGWAEGTPAVGAGGRSCSGPYCALKSHEMGVRDQSLGCIK